MGIWRNTWLEIAILGWEWSWKRSGGSRKKVSKAIQAERLGSFQRRWSVPSDTMCSGQIEISANGDTFLAAHVVCTLPLGVLKNSPTLFEPLLPPRKSAAINRLGYGLLSKVALRYEYPWWSEVIQTSS